MTLDALLPLYLEQAQPRPSVKTAVCGCWPKFLAFCAQQGLAIMKDKSRQLPTSTMLVPTDVEGAMQDVVTNFWNKNQSVEEAAKALAAALRG